MPLVTDSTHSVAIHEVKSDDEIATRIEVRALEVSDGAAGDALAVTSADDAGRVDVQLPDEPLARADLLRASLQMESAS